MKIRIVVLFLLFVNGLSAQILNYQPSVIYGKKYFIDNKRITKQELASEIAENRKAGELFIKSRDLKRKALVFNFVQIGGSIVAIYQAGKGNLSTTYRILAGTYLVGVGSLYFKEISENKLREAILEYNQAILRKLKGS